MEKETIVETGAGASKTTETVRDKSYFESKLPEGKETFTREEAAGLLFSEAEYSTRTASKGKVSEDALKAVQADLADKNTKLASYQEKEFNDQVSTEFKKLNGIKARREDLVKLAGLKQGMKPEEMSAAIVALKTNKNYEFLFKKVDSGLNQGQQHSKQTKPSNGPIRPEPGASRFMKMFKKK